MPRKNYTEREKRKLLALVDKYQSIIKNKSTTAVIVEQKNETWEKISIEFNATAEIPRTAKQLITAYQNMKRVSRQKDAEDCIIQEENTDIEREEMLKKDNSDDSVTEDKKPIMTTGVGSNTSVLDTSNFNVPSLPTFVPQQAQMLAMMGDQLKLLTNRCDSAADYHRLEEQRNIHAYNPPGFNVTEIVEEPTPLSIEIKTEREDTPPPIHQPKKKKSIRTIETLKRSFCKKKLECALLEKRTNMVNYRIALNKAKLVDLEIKIKQIEYEKLKQ